VTLEIKRLEICIDLGQKGNFPFEQKYGNTILDRSTFPQIEFKDKERLKNTINTAFYPK
jgi:hypothetical protein